MKNATDDLNSSPLAGSDGSKTLLIIRHAKSSWDAAGTLTDFERPLNERGKKDAPEMAARLKKRNIKVDAFISSPAKRAKKTAELFCTALHHPSESIQLISKLYHAEAAIFFEVILSLDNSVDTVAIFSHNPGITEFANLITDKTRIDNMPTCSILAIKVFTNNWADFAKTKKEFLFFDFPKNI